MTPEFDRKLDKKTLIELARKEQEVRIASLGSSIQKEMEAYKQTPDARDSWSDTSRSRIGGVIHGLQGQLSKEQKSLELFDTLDMEPTESVKTGSLVRVSEEEEEFFFLLVPRGGEKIEITEPKITVYPISATSPIGQALSGHRIGEMVEVKTPDGIRKLEIKETW